MSPSQFTRERPDAPDIPGRAVTFTFEGPLHSVYATLAVRLSHSMLFKRQAMWQNAASYEATVGGGCGLHLRELEEGRGELALFFDERANTTVRQQIEIETLLQQFARRERPLIPVILPGRQGRPRLPKFLGLWQVVDMRQSDPDPFERLVWAMTGQGRPQP